MTGERLSAAFEILKDLVKLITGEFTKRICPADERKDFVYRNRCESNQAHDVLRDDVVWLFLNPNWIKSALSDELCRHRSFNEIAHVRGYQNAVAAAIKRMSGASDTLNRARDAFRRRHHYDEIDRADVDTELKTR